jgi:hypothetical protein
MMCGISESIDEVSPFPIIVVGTKRFDIVLFKVQRVAFQSTKCLMKKEEQIILEVDGFEFFSNKEAGNSRGPKRDASAPTRPSSQNKERPEADRLGAYPRDTRAVLSGMTDRYAKNGRAQNVSFRKLVSWLKVGERATHYLHSYPAKLLPQIAHFFLAASHLTKPGDTVLDPFGGSGTVALEAILSGRKGLFADVNPLAQLIARVKTRPINPARLEAARARVQLRYAGLTSAQLPIPEVVNLTYWYSDESIASLNKIKAAIDLERQRDVREFLLVAFSGVSRKVSRADPRLSVPVRLKEIPAHKAAGAPDVWSVFDEQLKNNIRRMQVLTDCLADHASCQGALFAGNDARVLKQGSHDLKAAKAKLRKNSVALIITSPPYAGAQKYVRAASLNLGWLGLTKVDGLKPLENATIGREHFRKDSLAHCVATEIPAADRLIKRVHAINPLRAVIIST